MDKFRKQPYEIIIRGFDKTGLLDTGVTISSAAVSAINMATGADATATVLDAPTAVIESSTKMKCIVKAGTAGTDYKITFKATLSSGEQIEDDFLMEVREQ